MSIDFDKCYAKLRDPKRKSGVDYPAGSEDRITQRLQSLGLPVVDYLIDPDDFRRYFAEARYREDYPQYYSFVLMEKSLEHYLAARLLQLAPEDVYIDIASQHSPVPEIYHRLFGTTTYRQDLAYPIEFNGDKIGGDAANMPVPAEFASKMALHCSFEHFEGDSDIRFMREIERVLKPGGAVCFVPFYLSEEYSIQTDPIVAVAEDVKFEDGAILQCAPGWGNRHGRFYDPAHVVTRLVRNLQNLTMTIYRITNARSIDAACYVRFAMLITKPLQVINEQGRRLTEFTADDNRLRDESVDLYQPVAASDPEQNSLLVELDSARQQIQMSTAQVHAYEQLFQTIQSGRVYKIVRRLGGWKWVEQSLPRQK